MKLPKIDFPKRPLAVTPDQLTAVQALYEPYLPEPPIGIHKVIAKQLRIDEWRVHVAIKLIRKSRNLPRWNEERDDIPADMRRAIQEARQRMIADDEAAAAQKAADAALAKEKGSLADTTQPDTKADASTPPSSSLPVVALPAEKTETPVVPVLAAVTASEDETKGEEATTAEGEAPKRKRGRPSKKELEARKEAETHAAEQDTAEEREPLATAAASLEEEKAKPKRGRPRKQQPVEEPVMAQAKQA